MKVFFATLLSFFSFVTHAQYYYKDVVGTKESAALIKAYKNNKVRSVVLKTYTINNTPLDNFSVQQEFLPLQNALRTITKTDYSPVSYLTSFVDADGRVIKTTDSSAGVINTSVYTYTKSGQLASISTRFGDTLSALKTDDHIWQYDLQGKVSGLFRIKNKKDTAIVKIKVDEKGNVIEEQEARRTIKEEPFYYYYDDGSRLTDIVRFHKKAGRLLPEHMFEYNDAGDIIQKITVSQNSSDYLIWRYQHNDKGLKVREHVFNKQKELTGKIEYQYSYFN